ncbi:MAG: hypothetical protein ABIP06_04215 [Pyrinomonadaceae bacterium]
MRRLVKELMLGKNNVISGVIALGIVSAVAMGCTCGKNFDLANLSKDKETNQTVSNTDSTPDSTPAGDTLSDKSRGEVPSEREMEDLTKTTLLDFNEAVQSGDFTDFHGNISKVWKKTATPDAFNQGFKEFIDKKIDISGVKNQNADFDPQPTVTKKRGYKVLSANGKYDIYPLPAKFETEYIQEGGDWKLISIRIDTRK